MTLHEEADQAGAVVAPLERWVRPAAWIQHHKAGDNLEWEDPGGKRTALYDEQTLWNACARVAEIERGKLQAEAARLRAALRIAGCTLAWQCFTGKGAATEFGDEVPQEPDEAMAAILAALRA
jgi:hypothetical protein